jgi:hypothetical protein
MCNYGIDKKNILLHGTVPKIEINCKKFAQKPTLDFGVREFHAHSIYVHKFFTNWISFRARLSLKKNKKTYFSIIWHASKLLKCAAKMNKHEIKS